MAQDLEIDPDSVQGVVATLIDCQRRLERCILRTGPEHQSTDRTVSILHDERGRLLDVRCPSSTAYAFMWDDVDPAPVKHCLLM
jgi:hypothetical protein